MTKQEKSRKATKTASSHARNKTRHGRLKNSVEVSVSQVYVEPGIEFPFSHLMQEFVTKQISSVATRSQRFISSYGPGYSFLVNVSAEVGLTDNKICGPAVFRKEREVEYTLFLPFDVIVRAPSMCRAAMTFLLAGIHSACDQVGIDLSLSTEMKDSIIERVCSDASMIQGEWPRAQSDHT